MKKGTNVDCSRWRELASDYIEGSLPAESAQAMAAHTETCASCKSDHAALRSLCRELNVLPTVDPPLFFADNVMAAIERDRSRFALQNGAHSGPWWQTMLPQLGRVALGTALTGGAVVALVWTLLLPGENKTALQNAPQIARLPSAAVLPDFLPGGEGAGNAPAPNLRIARVTTIVPSSGPAFDLALWMENTDEGTARFNLLGDKTPYRFHLGGVTAPQTLRVPFSAALDKQTVGLHVYWTANASHHTRYLFVPIPQISADTADKTDKTDRTAGMVSPARQSFGLPEQSLTDAAREVATRYRVPVTIDDVPEDVRVQITARDETAPETLTRNLAPFGLRVSEVKGGLLIEPAAPPVSAEANAATTPPVPSAP